MVKSGKSDACRLCHVISRFLSEILVERIDTSPLKISPGSLRSPAWSLAELLEKRLGEFISKDDKESSHVCVKFSLKIRNTSKAQFIRRISVTSNIQVPETH